MSQPLWISMKSCGSSWIAGLNCYMKVKALFLVEPEFNWRRWDTSISVVSSPDNLLALSRVRLSICKDAGITFSQKSFIMGEWWVCCNEALVINFRGEISSTRATMIFLPMSNELQWDWWYVTWNSCVTFHSSLSPHLCHYKWRELDM